MLDTTLGAHTLNHAPRGSDEGGGVVQHPIAQKAWNKLSQGQWAMNRRAMNAEPLPHLNFHYWGLRE